MIDWEVHKVKLSELKDFLNNRLSFPQSVIPISPPRATSYLNNPKASPSDHVLYFIEEGTKIIAFRTVWADTVMLDGKPLKFGWCSGNWVSPEFRRKGLSGLLLRKMVADWDGKLMFTNYAPESEAGYIKTNLFPAKHLRTGIRFYFNSNLNELFAQRNKHFVKKLAIALVNVAYRLIFRFKRAFFVPHSLKGLKIEVENSFSNHFPFANQPSAFDRKPTDFQWIFNYPWVENEVNAQNDYPFSWKAQAFEYKFVTIENNDIQLCSFVISNREGAVKLLYWQLEADGKKWMAKWMANYCHQNNVKTLTIIDPEMAMAVKAIRTPFVVSKSFCMNIYSTFEFDSANKKIFDGDGDYIFT